VISVAFLEEISSFSEFRTRIDDLLGRITPLPESGIEGPHWRSIGGLPTVRPSGLARTAEIVRPFFARFKAQSFVIFHLLDWQKIRELVDKYKLFVTNRVNLAQTQNLARGDSRGGSTPPSGTNEIKSLQQS